MRCFSILLVFITGTLFISCEKNKYDIDISNIETNQTTKRFEQDLFEKELDTAFFAKNYGDFYTYYIVDMLSIGNAGDLGVKAGLESFVADETMKEVYAKIVVDFVGFNSYELDIKNAFKRYKYHFDDKSVPDLVTYMSGFNYAMGVTENDVAVGLDMYLGSDCGYYDRLGYPRYKSFNMNPDNMPIDCLKGWIGTEFFATEKDEKTLLSKIIYDGKILFLLDAVFPNKEDSIKIGFSQYEIDWCKKNEFNLWSHFVDKQLLYSKNQNIIVQYTKEGPFTTGFDKTSPARVGTWMGWQIVREFMNKNEQLSLIELMELKDAQILLTKSGYKPK